MTTLTAPQTAALRAELLTDPASMGYAAHIPDAPGVLVQMLDTPTADTMPAEHWLTDRGLIAEITTAHGLAMSDAILDALDAQAALSKSIGRLVARLYSDAQGLNFGDAALRAVIQAWRGTALTEPQADALLALPMAPASRRQMLGLPPLGEPEIRAALQPAA